LICFLYFFSSQSVFVSEKALKIFQIEPNIPLHLLNKTFCLGHTFSIKKKPNHIIIGVINSVKKAIFTSTKNKITTIKNIEIIFLKNSEKKKSIKLYCCSTHLSKIL
jgi:hypothetical protein